MELRSSSHLHFIQAITRGTVEKTLNLDPHGRPAFRFKTIEAIYESENAKNMGSSTTSQQQGGGLMGLPLGSGEVKIDCSVLLMEDRKIKSDPEFCDFNMDACDIKRNSNMDEFRFSEITLKQLKERCKTKKRKLLKYFDLEKEDPCSHLNEDCTQLQLKKDESDLEETLSSWKLKRSKKPMAKRKCIRKVHSPSKSAVPDLVSEESPSVPQDPHQSTEDLNRTIKTNIDISELNFSDCHGLDGLTFGATHNTHYTVDTCTNVADEVAGISIKSELAVGESTSLVAESPNCVVTGVSIEYLEHENSLSHPASAAVGEAMEGSFSEVVNEEILSSPVSKLDANVRIIQSTPSTSPVDESCVTNKPAYEMSRSWEGYSFMRETSCKIDSSSVTYMPQKLNDNLRCMEASYDGGYILNVESESGSKEDTLPDLETTAIRAPDILYMSFENSYTCSNSLSEFNSIGGCSSNTIEKQNHSYMPIDESVSAGVDMESEGDVKDVNSSDPETTVVNNSGVLHNSSQNCHTCSNPLSNLKDFNSATDVTLTFPIKEGPVSNISRLRDCSVGSNPSDESCTTIEVLENFCDLKLESPPKRLFTTRKAISPTSQEKLRQAVAADCLNDDIGLSKCRERLCFEEQSKSRASSARSELKGVEVNVNLQRIILKPRNQKCKSNFLVPKGILKSPNVSCAIPHAATVRNSSHPHAKSAIEFSQRQMRDIEYLAMKLVKELNCIKDIVEDNLHSEVYPSTTSKYTVDEMRVAVHKAGEVEETTRKMLSMMAKDCSRFCKIMRSSGEKSPAAPTSVHGLKDRKRITFADEAGGPLCHVKVFKDQLASLSGSECENDKCEAIKTERNAGCTLQC